MTRKSKPSRRLFLAAGSVGAVFGALGAAVAAEAQDADPIYAAIERHRATDARYCEACNLTDEILAKQQGREVTATDLEIVNAAEDADAEALEALMTTAPLTKAGARSALAYFLSMDCLTRGPRIVQFVETLLSSPVLADLEARS